MALSSQRIVQMIATPPSAVNAGRARFAVQQAKGTPSHEQFARDMADLPVQRQPESTLHPRDAVRGQARLHKELTPSSVAFLQRLPQDPAQVPFRDATTVAAMHAGVSHAQQPGSPDRVLLDSIWEPIEAFHDQRAADAAVRNASKPLPPVPQSALQALVDAIRAEVPSLTDAEVVNRARDALAAAVEDRSADHGMKQWGAQARAADVRTAAAQRAAVTS